MPGASRPGIDKIGAALGERFAVTDLWACRFYLGVKVIRDRPRRVLRLFQRAYVGKVLRGLRARYGPGGRLGSSRLAVATPVGSSAASAG